LIKPRVNKSFKPNLRARKDHFILPVQKKTSLLNEDTFKFLNRSYSLSEFGWNGDTNVISKLWRYNQHYFDDLVAVRSYQRKAWHDKLLKRWVNENMIGKGVGWEPYPVSLRIVNWIKWQLSGNKLSNHCIQSLALQATWLSKKIEWHIQGNHLFSNAKALVFVGLFFSNKETEILLKKGLKIIDEELNEQVLNDGGNFERSPMYHAIFLEDIFDLINISKTYPNIIKESQINKWIKIADNMLRWLNTMIHPDGNIAFFNDSAFEIASNFKELKKYAQRLGIHYSDIQFNEITHLADSGYIRLKYKDLFGLIDVAPIGPDYLPGHAHADTLSFEISLFGQRIIVNSGTSEYKVSSIRKYERSTKAHNTVVVNDKNSSEVWSSFRVAKRAYPLDLKIKNSNNYKSIYCTHDGYKRLKGKPIHKRSWEFFESSLIIKDHLEGSFESAYAYFHFHPLINISKENNHNWKLETQDGKKINFNIKIGDAKVENSFYSPEFGKRIETKRLKVSLDKKNGSCIQILW
jgi:uncharacterized heparinase superfamily protein